MTLFSITVNANDIKIMIDDVHLETDVAPVIVNDRTLLPIRTIVENIGGTVDWDAETSKAIIEKGSDVLTLEIDSLIANVNGEDVTLDVPAQIIDERTMVPVRFVSETLGLKVEFSDGIVYIETETVEEEIVEINEDDIYNSIMALQNKYPQGLSWTNDNYYFVNAISLNAYGCVAFAYEVSDTVFGDLPITQTDDFNNIRVGDLIRMNGGSHTVVVLKVDGDTVTVVEGNFNDSVNWGREIKMSEILSSAVSLTTRYQ